MRGGMIGTPRLRALMLVPSLWLALAPAIPAGCGGAGPAPAEGGSGEGDAAGEGGDTAGDGGSDDVPQPALQARPAAPRYALVGEPIVLDGSASTGAVSYEWYFGDGTGWDAPRAEPNASVAYGAPGRYQAVLTVFDRVGDRHAASVTVSVTAPAIYTGRTSRTLAPLPPPADGVVAVSADADMLVVIARAADRFQVARRIATCKRPRTVTVWQAFIVAACQGDDRLAFHPLAAPAAGTAEPPPAEVTLPYGAAPFGVAGAGSALFASLQGTGQLAEVQLAAGVPVLRAVVTAVTDARAVAPLPDGRVAVSRWRSPDERGEIAIVDVARATAETLALAFDPQPASDAEIGGVPSYLAEIAVSPTGREAVVPSLVANVRQGMFGNGRPLTFETTVRAALSRLDLGAGREDFGGRIQFDDLGFATAAAFSARGDFAYVVMPGNRAVVRVDLLTGADAGVFVEAGSAPDGAVVTPDDRFLLVNAALSRELVVFDAGVDVLRPHPIDRIPLLTGEPLDPIVLRGKQLFNDAADGRISKSGYIACAHCHLDGDSDRRVWDFTDRGEGLRNTVSLLGRAGLGDGPVHWSANFDEIQDFEHDIRGPFGGTGLMSDAAFQAGTRATTLGDRKAGASADLDALAAYVGSLAAEPRSPFRSAGGALGSAASRGKALFESPALGCTVCHTGARLTDSRWLAPGQPALHDVGTLGPGSGGRLGGPLTGLDTPTLHGLWRTPPYLHDGSAPDLAAVLRARNPQGRHGDTSALTAAALDDLVAYLLALDGRSD
jgi:hypothetical protein